MVSHCRLSRSICHLAKALNQVAFQVFDRECDDLRDTVWTSLTTSEITENSGSAENGSLSSEQMAMILEVQKLYTSRRLTEFHVEIQLHRAQASHTTYVSHE
uniref:Uncharacterized protein n=1 Tax=Cryptomonas curvata TaxID=233186 RepID=A0A7S0QWY8_9CRYP|mmetsp:Transcript_56796/g.118779  ORF Transcript_56796/g.118779 Transcript_56796/m.118779 type:complete len:102 (+) Transcript_56796:348-653(+)